MKTEDMMSIDEHQEDFTSNDLEEAHYVHTIRDVVDLIDTYGWEPVLKDIIRLKEKRECF